MKAADEDCVCVRTARFCFYIKVFKSIAGGSHMHQQPHSKQHLPRVKESNTKQTAS